jgi:hypothetical protein
MMSSAARVFSTVGAALLLIGTALSAQTRINTPFEVGSLWSEDMLRHLTGERQPACSGEKSADCKRLHEGICDGTVNVAFGDAFPGSGLPLGTPTIQSGTGAPKGFRLVVSNELFSPGGLQFRALGREESLELTFECADTGAGADCPTGIFHVGVLRVAEVRTPDGERLFDLMPRSRVHPEGEVMVSLDDAMRKVLDFGTHPFYRVRVAAQCFVVPAVAVDWRVPVHDGPSATSKSLGAIIARVTRFQGIEWIYRANDGKEVSFEPDWVQADTGYDYLMEQTILDRRGEWVQLPRRPFPQAVWLQRPVRERGDALVERGSQRLRPGVVYRLSKAVTARVKDGTRTVAFNDQDTFVVVAIRDRVLEIRKDEEFDSPCSDGKAPAGRTFQTFLVNAEEFYDADLHLQVMIDAPKGC